MGTKQTIRRVTPLVAIAGALVLSGCVSQQAQMEADKASMAQMEAMKSREAEIKKAEMALKDREMDLKRKENMAARTKTTRQQYFPPTPKPGQCFARVLTPATYGTQTDKVVVREASERIEVTPPQFAVVDEKVLVQEAYERTVITPAEYGTKTEKLLVKPASSRLVATPPEYKTVTERVIDTPATTVWKRGSAVVDGALQTRIDNSTGDIMCLVDVPATYKTISKVVLAKPAGTKEVAIPAEYRTVSRTVLVKPEKIEKIKIPAEYRTIRKQKLVKPAGKKVVKIPAEYGTVTKRIKKTDETITWRDALCDVNLTSANITTMQNALKKSGMWSGNVDGRLSADVMNAINAFAKKKGLPSGDNYIAIETAAELGVK